MYRDKAMRVTPRPMSNNKMETSPLIEEVYDSRRDVARRRGENGRVRGGTGGLVSRVQIGKVSVRCELLRVANLSS